MSLPILSSRPEPTAADLIRLYYRTELHWARQLAEEEAALDIGTALFNPSLPDVADANNQVNINDLLLVINNWGTAGPGDCDPPCGNGTVNINDLLAVINAWGPCP